MKEPKTKIGKFWRDKVVPNVGNIIDVGLDVVSGDFNDAFQKVKEAVRDNIHDEDEAKKITSELEAKREELEHDWRLALMEHETKRIELANAAREQLLQHELETFKAEVQDKSRASVREIDYLRATGKRDWLMGTVVLMVMIMMLGVITCLVFVKIPVENQRLADMSFGTVLTMAMAVVGYYVGTTKSSRQKDETISKMQSK
jgi:hypothetical protein